MAHTESGAQSGGIEGTKGHRGHEEGPQRTRMWRAGGAARAHKARATGGRPSPGLHGFPSGVMSRGSYTSSLVAVGALVAFSACVALAANAGESQAALYATTTSSRVAPAVGGAPLRAPRSPVQAADALQTPAAVARQYTRPSAARSMSHDTVRPVLVHSTRRVPLITSRCMQQCFQPPVTATHPTAFTVPWNRSVAAPESP